jgi:hypothetical protein
LSQLQENLQQHQKSQTGNMVAAYAGDSPNQTKATQTQRIFEKTNSSDSLSTLRPLSRNDNSERKKAAHRLPIERDADTSFASLTGSLISDAINLEPEEKVIFKTSTFFYSNLFECELPNHQEQRKFE